MNFLLFKKHNSPSESCSKFFYIICWWTFYWHWNNWIRNKNWFLNESKFNIILIYWNTYHTNLICFIINKSITSSTIETIKCTNISSISFINFLKVQKMIDSDGKNFILILPQLCSNAYEQVLILVFVSMYAYYTVYHHV
jgi:hypothetical protein